MLKRKQKIDESRCFVCQKRIKPLEQLRKERKMVKYVDKKLIDMVERDVVRISTTLIRHRCCEPGSAQYMKSPALAASFKDSLQSSIKNKEVYENHI